MIQTGFKPGFYGVWSNRVPLRTLTLADMQKTYLGFRKVREVQQIACCSTIIVYFILGTDSITNRLDRFTYKRCRGGQATFF
jgi:hypothetical protein